MDGDIEIIDQPTYNKLIKPVIKNGGTVIRNTETSEHLLKYNASASNIGDTILFGEKITISDVLEETYHFKQNLNKLNYNKTVDMRLVLNEIDAKKYLLSVSKKYKVPQCEIELTKQQLKYYENRLKEMEDSNEY